MENTVYILRGFPGGGKSTVAKTLAGNDGIICSADDYFINSEGEYFFQPIRLKDAHSVCFGKFLQALKDGCPTVVLDNTNILKAHFTSYKVLGESYGYMVSVLEVNIPKSKEDLEVLIKRGTHGVPRKTYYRWMEQYE